MSKLKHIKDPGFKAPKGYFENLDALILERVNTESIKTQIDVPGFDMPEDYFETFEDRVFEKLNTDNKDVKVISLFSKRKLLYVSGIAAALVLMFSIFINQDEQSLNDLDYELVEDYILEQNISSYELAALLTEDELSEVNSEIMGEAFGDEALEDYIIENIDLEHIIEQ
ncbi:MAG: hypothetical protein HKO00_03425 [Flavobacteriaceae bacterium]|nr:hypothetical protein [Flavobacteriaceae bacterium]